MDPTSSPDDGTARPAAPPALDDLLTLPRNAWADVVAHARRALAELDDSVRTATVKRLQAAPANKLLGGRSRRALAEVFAAGGPAWVALHRRLRDADVGEDLAFLVEGTAGPEAPPAEVTAGSEDVDLDRLTALEADVAKLRDRGRRLREQRDEARRQVEGTAARLEAAQADLAATRDALEAARAEVVELQARLSGSDRDRERAVDRERRRQEAALAKARDEASALRRADEDRRKARQERDRRAVVEAERAERRAAEEREMVRVRRAGAADLAAPGRPSEFPPGVAPGTTAHAKALLGPGRRILVDGYNVAKSQRPDLGDEAAERQWLEDALSNLIAMRHVKVEVYWDGDQREGSSTRRGDLQIVFAPRDVTADDDIELALAASPDDEPLVVVTDDRGLRDRLLPYRVDLLGTQPFAWALRG